jgi:hypothetical protein
VAACQQRIDQSLSVPQLRHKLLANPTYLLLQVNINKDQLQKKKKRRKLTMDVAKLSAAISSLSGAVKLRHHRAAASQ